MDKKYEFTLPVGTIIIGDVMPNGNGEHYQYHVESVLGQGGFGITYKVWCIVKNGQIRTRTSFAIKEHFVKGRCHRAKNGVTVEYSQEAAADVEDSLKDFVKEGRLLQSICQVKNPKDSKNKGYQNIVPVNEVIEANNTAYFVMEYLDGGSLRDMIQKNGTGMNEEKALSLIVPICQAVSYIHSHGILHMDIKPENIVMRRNLVTMQEEPVLIDFGVSLHFDKKGSLTTTHTSFGRSEGYSPVEQYGEIVSFQPKLDVYALGATLLYLLEGKVPPSAFNVTTEYLEKNIPLTVSERTRKAILHAMKKDSHYRTPSADIFISELEDRYTLPVGYVLHGPNVNYLITGINVVKPFYIKYDAVVYTGDNRNPDDTNVTRTHQYVVYEYYVKDASKRQEDESVKTKGKPYYYDYLEKIQKRTGLGEIGESVSSDIRVECELFNSNETVYAVVDRNYKPASGFSKSIDKVSTILKQKAKKIGIIAAYVVGSFFLILLIPALYKACQKSDEDWARDLTKAIEENNLEELQTFADKDSARAILPLAKLLLGQGDTTNARMYAEKAFAGELELDTTEAKRIILAIQDYVISDRLAKQEAARKDSIEKARKDSLAKVENQQTSDRLEVEKRKNEEKTQKEELSKREKELQEKEEQKRKEDAQKKEKERLQNEAAQKVANQAEAARKALQYVNGERSYENHRKAYEWAQKADPATRDKVIQRLKDLDFPVD